MTSPTLTYGHGLLDDGDDISNWVENLSGMTDGQTSIAVEHGDIYKLTGVCDAAGDEYVYYERDIDNISTAIYTKYLLRWKTSASSNGLGAKARLVFTAGSQTILPTSGEIPQFSTAWQVTSGTITPAKTIDKIQLFADDYPDSIDSGTYYVYYDFILLHKNTFTFPFVDDIAPDFPDQHVDIPMPGRQGPVTQYIGSKEPVSFRLSGKIDIGASSSWGEPILEYLYRIWKDAYKEPWQWFSTGGLTDEDRIFNGKVTLRTLPFVENKEATRTWSVTLKQYSLSDLSESTWDDLQGLGI